MNHTNTIRRVLAVILALVMVCGLCACGQDDTPDVPSTSYEQVAEEFLKAYYLRDYIAQFPMIFYNARQQREDAFIAQQGSAEAFFAHVQKQAKDEQGLDVTINSFDDYFTAYHQHYVNSAHNVYGAFTLTTKATAAKKMEGDILAQFIDKQLGALDAKYVDADAYHSIQDAYIVTVNLTIDGEKKDLNENYLVYVVYHNGQWWVAEHSI